jgi:hydroxymethylglutaryl-CoA lyase
MSDSAKVFEQIDWQNSQSKLLAIVANQRGAEDAVKFKQISYLGYPLSLSETFQQRNTKRSISTALEDLKEIQDLCLRNNKILVVYLSMGFGNPYGDPYNASFVQEFVEKLNAMQVKIISLSDTIGVADPALITSLLSLQISAFPHIEFGAHLHSRPEDIGAKVRAGAKAGCRRFDGALKGFGGCPMANDELVGNMATEVMIGTLESSGFDLKINKSEFAEAMKLAGFVFNP